MAPISDVLISAGHEGRKTGNTGSPGQIRWTPQVADRATKVLRKAGLTVIRKPADFRAGEKATLAVFIHFDGSEEPCTSGASVGYKGASDKPAADAWKAIYSEYWPFEWEDDNFTENLRQYFGYKLVDTTDGEIVIEMGEISCPEQKAWMAPRLSHLGDILAYFVSQRLKKGDVPKPEVLD